MDLSPETVSMIIQGLTLCVTGTSAWVTRRPNDDKDEDNDQQAEDEDEDDKG
jgi:hypothetical protein